MALENKKEIAPPPEQWVDYGCIAILIEISHETKNDEYCTQYRKYMHHASL